MTTIHSEDVINLLHHCLRRDYNVRRHHIEDETISQKVLQLYSKDYQNIVHITQYSPTGLCDTYPQTIFIPVGDETDFSKELVHEKFESAKTARCRQRFPCPVFYVGNGKYVCRSATLSSWLELSTKVVPSSKNNSTATYNYNENGTSSVDVGNSTSNLAFDSDPSSTDIVRANDIDLLKMFGVKAIIDLMLENSKHVLGVRCSSSEKVDSQDRYRKQGKMQLFILPFPGCEYFSKWYKAGNDADFNCKYNWLADTGHDVHPSVDNRDDLNDKLVGYQSLTLIELTNIYLQMILDRFLFDDSSDGILIHCISGWDRTPLYVCLVRILLWAAGIIHKSLSVEEIVYLVIGYDWYLFGHNFCSRVANKQMIMVFAFQCLPLLRASTLQSTINFAHRQNSLNNSKEDIEAIMSHRLHDVSKFFTECFAQCQQVVQSQTESYIPNRVKNLLPWRSDNDDSAGVLKSIKKSFFG